MTEPPSSELPSQPSLRRMRTFAVRPKRDLGQNFLVDSNILGVIERAAKLGPEDVVLEIGGGLGVLSEYLAARTEHTHVVELDRSLEPALREALDPFPNTTLHLADALALDLPSLDPAPTKVVANLPYGIAATAILNTVFELPTVTLWVAMVQKEVGERFAAQAGTAAYGVPSVLAQLACDVRVHRSVSRSVFHPVPNVDSVLVVLERTGPPPPEALRTLVQGAFAHRRKALARSLQLAAKDPAWRDRAPASLQLDSGDKGLRDRARAALVEIGLPEDARAERLTPDQFRALGERIGA
ncbi:MAG: rRNA (adenine1518-N6/adenine1519-N6)-dimethyltransferase [Baekduia sp.]|nr:rRNA (adenine1518-N6/adenine1519-N6)-dimethyltransferase [Baekduia sp.]